MPLEEQQQAQPQQQQNNAQTIEPRRKRAKIVSACGECRRKKTKCNGEQPCRNCEKSGVPCIYPSSSSNDDKRNAPSKAALEAIEERLKTIEDMLRTIIKAQQNVLQVDMDPVVNQFLNSGAKSSSSSVISSPPPSSSSSRIHHQPHHTTRSSPPPSQLQHNQSTSPPPSSSSSANRLPSIRSLSTSYSNVPVKIENRDILPPLGFQQQQQQQQQQNYGYPPPSSTYQSLENEDYMKKRKR